MSLWNKRIIIQTGQLPSGHTVLSTNISSELMNLRLDSKQKALLSYCSTKTLNSHPH